MANNFFLILFLAAISLTGCSMNSISNSIRATHYLSTRNYEQGETSFRRAVARNPDNAQANYYLGRFLLAEKKPAAALSPLQKAVASDPSDADYHFWLGVALGENDYNSAEQEQYRKALQIRKYHMKARLYLGHLQLKKGELISALHSYDTVLKRLPLNPSALYNRALILGLQRKNSEAKKAWLKYLKYYPAGKHAIWATQHLNALGDFSYENHYFGKRTVTLAKIAFLHNNTVISVSSYPSLRLVGAIVSNMDSAILQIVVFKDGDPAAAKQRATLLKTTLHDLFPTIKSDRIRISWFGSREHIDLNGKKYSKPESVRFFLTNPDEP